MLLRKNFPKINQSIDMIGFQCYPVHNETNRDTGDRKETHRHDRYSLWYGDVHDGHGNDDHAHVFVRFRE